APPTGDVVAAAGAEAAVAQARGQDGDPGTGGLDCAAEKRQVRELQPPASQPQPLQQAVQNTRVQQQECMLSRDHHPQGEEDQHQHQQRRHPAGSSTTLIDSRPASDNKAGSSGSSGSSSSFSSNGTDTAHVDSAAAVPLDASEELSRFFGALRQVAGGLGRRWWRSETTPPCFAIPRI
ncbi:hypothetical protein Agub_g9102, partial [Astrephomene gubernaculifera]